MRGEREQGLEGKNARLKSAEYIENAGFCFKNKAVWVGGSIMPGVCSLSGVDTGTGTVAYTP